MRVTHLSLLDFRNYRVVELPLEPGANLIVGRNGQGKTNLVEAIAYFSSLRSHRVSGDAALIRAGCSAAIARLGVRAEERSVRLELQINRTGQNRAQINGNPTRARELMRWFSSVTFAPEDLTIVRGEPSVRRRFLDDALIARSPAAAGVLSDYERVVRQRTSLLKSARAHGARSGIEATLSVWDEQLVELGTRIMEARRQLIVDMSEPVREAYGRLVGADHAPVMKLNETLLTALGKGSVSRETLWELEQASVSRETLVAHYRAALESVRQQELERAVTLVGPHRDDLGMDLNGLPVKGYASHGESWSFALALRLGLASILRAESLAGDPVIILDDVFAELDAGRRARLMSALSDYEQVIVTAAVEEDVPADIDWHRTEIRAGGIVPIAEASEVGVGPNADSVGRAPGRDAGAPGGGAAGTGDDHSGTRRAAAGADADAAGIPVRAGAGRGENEDAASGASTAVGAPAAGTPEPDPSEVDPSEVDRADRSAVGSYDADRSGAGAGTDEVVSGETGAYGAEVDRGGVSANAGTDVSSGVSSGAGPVGAGPGADDGASADGDGDGDGASDTSVHGDSDDSASAGVGIAGTDGAVSAVGIRKTFERRERDADGKVDPTVADVAYGTAAGAGTGSSRDSEGACAGRPGHSGGAEDTGRAGGKDAAEGADAGRSQARSSASRGSSSGDSGPEERSDPRPGNGRIPDQDRYS